MTLAKIKRIIVSVIGFTVLIIGIFLIVFPGPAFIVIPVGLAILATEYAWAKNLFEKVKKVIRKSSKE
jgi:uncharacterized protein (TIGR02611 family)